MENKMNNHSQSAQSNIVILSIVGIVLLIIAGIGGYYFGKKTTQQKYTAVMGNEATRPPIRGERSMRMGMTPVTPPLMSDQQNQQLSIGTDSAITQKTFNITGGNFYFVPDKITVNKGDTVTFVMTNAGGIHDINIDELNIRKPVIKSAEAESITFTATKTGSFIFDCDVMGHRQKGMFGTLVVQ